MRPGSVLETCARMTCVRVCVCLCAEDDVKRTCRRTGYVVFAFFYKRVLRLVSGAIFRRKIGVIFRICAC